MYLKSLELKGFKSFPDRTKIDFPKGMICIAGPNGSGKSNILDAIKWVLGEQSIKSLRGEKLEDVIFTGTKVRSPMGYCEVIINIDNEDGRLPIEYTELSIKRKAYRSGESRFYINNNKCRLKDIKEILLDTGIGQEGYSLISQGKIDEIIEANGSELRSLLEEASGIAKHRYKKSEAEKNLFRAKENLARIEDVYIEIERQFKPLKEQKEKAEKYISLTENLKKLRVNKFLRENEKIYEKIDSLEMEYKKIDERLNNNISNRKIIENKKLNLTKILSEIKINLDKIKNEYDLNVSDITNYENEVKINLERIKNLKSNNTNINSEIEDLKDNIKKIIDKKETYSKNIEELKNKIDDFKKDREIKVNLINSDKNELKEKNQNSVDLEYSIQNIDTEINKLQTKSEMLQNTIDSLEDKMKEYDEEKIKFDEKISDYTNNKFEKEKALNEKTVEKEKLESVINYNLQNLKKLDEDIENLKDRYQNQKQDYNTLLSQTNMLISFEENMQGVSRPVRTLIKDSNIKGIVDIVSNVIQVKSGYEIAIETLLGNRTENIILEDTIHVKDAINYLKREKLGRATFLPLTTINGSEINYNDTGIRAIDVLEFDEKYRGIISFLIGKNIIVKDIDTALYISKKYNQSLRIATLSGELFNVGGAITGGNNKYNKEVFTRKNKIRKNKSKLKNMSTELNYLHEMIVDKNKEKESRVLEIEEQKEKIKNVSESIELFKNELSELEFNLKSENFQKDRVLSEIEAIIKSNSSSKETIKANNKEIIVLHEKLDSCEEKYNKNKEEINKIKEKISINENEFQELNLEITRNDELYKSQISFLNSIEISYNENIQKSEKLKEKFERNKQELEHLCELNIEKEEKISILSEKVLKHKEIIAQKFSETKEKEEEIISLDSELAQNQDNKSEIDKQIIIIQNNIEREKDKSNLISDRLYELYRMDIQQAKDIEDKSLSVTTKEISELINKINSLGNVNLDSIEEFEKLNERYIFYSNQMEDLSSSIKKINTIIKELEKLMITDFEENFKIINKNFSDTFKILFGGGNGKLVLEDEQNLLTSDIQISVQPPGKNLKKISMLSGGERALSAIALLFAIILCKPVPFCVLDEIDAPLDDVNIYRYVKFLRTLVEDTQFIVITHRRTTMEESDYMYGVSMPEKGVSKIVSIDLKDMEEYIDE